LEPIALAAHQADFVQVRKLFAHGGPAESEIGRDIGLLHAQAAFLQRPLALHPPRAVQ
jgi:hypothetical protein